jgi:thymidylate synthase (FAD)
MQNFINRQGSEGVLDAVKGAELTKDEEKLHKMCREIYEKRIAMGVARELARKDLPLSTYTEAYWKIDLKNLLHFLELRMEKKAQHEIREYANVINNEIVRRWCPVTWEAFNDYRLDTTFLSKVDQKIMIPIIKGDAKEAIKAAKEAGFITETPEGFKRSVECIELEGKLQTMGQSIPWIK